MVLTQSFQLVLFIQSERFSPATSLAKLMLVRIKKINQLLTFRKGKQVIYPSTLIKKAGIQYIYLLLLP